MRTMIRKFLLKAFPELIVLTDDQINLSYLRSSFKDSKAEDHTRMNAPYRVSDVTIGRGTYVASNSMISRTRIGRFCSIGPNFLCGWGIHPTNGLSTSPAFYSTHQQSGLSFAQENKVEERKPITIGNDVFIGANVVILDGVTIGDGAVIGAGAIVSKDIPPYSIAVGCPIRIIRYRFDDATIDRLLQIRWWQWSDDQLKEVERYFFEIDTFIQKHAEQQSSSEPGNQLA